MEARHISGPVRRISSRYLGRNVAELLDDVERDGNSVLIIRYGRPCALLSPVGDDIAVRGPIPAPEEYAEEIADLTDVERRLLLTLVDGEWHPDPVHNVCEVTEGLLALSKLELKHFVSRGAGWWLHDHPIGGPRGQGLGPLNPGKSESDSPETLENRWRAAGGRAKMARCWGHGRTQAGGVCIEEARVACRRGRAHDDGDASDNQ